jgi:hypothetical protein
MCFYFVCFYTRSDNLRVLLLKVSDLKRFQSKRPNQNNRQRLVLIGLLFLKFAFVPFLHADPEVIIYMYLFPLIINCFENLFLNDVLGLILHKFETIYLHLQRQVNSVDMLKTFTLSRIEKIRAIQEEKKSSNIRHTYS